MNTLNHWRTRRLMGLGVAVATAALCLVLTWTLLDLRAAVAAPVATLNVDNSDPLCNDLTGAPYCTIQAAVDDAVDSDTIAVAAGTYTENVEVASKSIRVSGAGLTQTIVNGNDAGRVFFAHDGDSIFEDLTIKNGHAPGNEPFGGGIWVTNGAFTIRRVRVLKN